MESLTKKMENLKALEHLSRAHLWLIAIAKCSFYSYCQQFYADILFISRISLSSLPCPFFAS